MKRSECLAKEEQGRRKQCDGLKVKTEESLLVVYRICAACTRRGVERGSGRKQKQGRGSENGQRRGVRCEWVCARKKRGGGDEARLQIQKREQPRLWSTQSARVGKKEACGEETTGPAEEKWLWRLMALIVRDAREGCSERSGCDEAEPERAGGLAEEEEGGEERRGEADQRLRAAAVGRVMWEVWLEKMGEVKEWLGALREEGRKRRGAGEGPGQRPQMAKE